MSFKIIKAALRLSMPLLLCAVSLNSSAQAQTRSKSYRKIEPNVYAPDLYADRIKIKLSLVDLPGAVESKSYWEASYQIFFISEANLQAALKNAPAGGWNPTPADFPGRILLGQGTFRRNRLRTLTDRTYLSRAIPLKVRVPDKLRTKFATILTSYSVKIFDARLKSNIYKAGTFATQPFMDDPASGGNETARSLLYANFYVSSNGHLFYSQKPRNSENTTW
jgi:hypothetical protein